MSLSKLWSTALLNPTPVETGCEQGKIPADTQWPLTVTDTPQAAKQEEWEEKTKLGNLARMAIALSNLF